MSQNDTRLSQNDNQALFRVSQNDTLNKELDIKKKKEKQDIIPTLFGLEVPTIDSLKGTHKEIFLLPNWVPADAWNGYVEMRAKKYPLTNYAKKIELRELDKLRGEGQEPRAVLEQSISKCWQGLFAVKNGNGNPQPEVEEEDAITAMRRREAARKAKS